MKATRIVTSLVLLLAIVIGYGIPMYAFAESSKTELVELRTANSKTFRLLNDTFEARVFLNDIHYQTPEGWEEIDNSIVESERVINGQHYTHKNSANQYTARFGDINGSSSAVMLDYYGRSIGFSPVDANPSAVFASEFPTDAKLLFDMAIKENSIAYKNVYESVDIVYEAMTGGVKEFIVLNSKNARNEFVFDIKTVGLTLVDGDNGIELVDQAGNVLMYISDLFAIDSAANYTEDVSCEIIANENGTQLKVVLDEEYFKSEDRLFPIIIDPTTMISGSSTVDTFVSSACPNRNFNTSGNSMFNYLGVGRDLRTMNPSNQSTATEGFGVTRSYLKFTLPTNISSSSVTGATVRLKFHSGAYTTEDYESPLGMKVYPLRCNNSWNGTTMTYNSGMPGVTSGSNYATFDIEDWFQVNITSFVKDWLTTPSSNYGLALAEKNQNYSSICSYWQFYSSDAASPNKPELRIYYTNSTFYGVRPYEQSNGTNQNCMGYALNKNVNINGVELGLLTGNPIDPEQSVYLPLCSNAEDIQNAVISLSETWMNSKSVTFSSISAYNSSISSTRYRVVLRSMCFDNNGNGSFNYSMSKAGLREDYDYHWWYQTSDGSWAEKHGLYYSAYVINSHNTNPANLTAQWSSFYPGFTMSSLKYYSILP